MRYIHLFFLFALVSGFLSSYANAGLTLELLLDEPEGCTRHVHNVVPMTSPTKQQAGAGNGKPDLSQHFAIKKMANGNPIQLQYHVNEEASALQAQLILTGLTINGIREHAKDFALIENDQQFKFSIDIGYTPHTELEKETGIPVFGVYFYTFDCSLSRDQLNDENNALKLTKPTRILFKRSFLTTDLVSLLRQPAGQPRISYEQLPLEVIYERQY